MKLKADEYGMMVMMAMMTMMIMMMMVQLQLLLLMVMSHLRYSSPAVLACST